LSNFFNSEDSFTISRISYQKIFSHKDLDGLFGGGLILRIYEAPIAFVSRITSAQRAIIIEVPLSSTSMLDQCLIIDHHHCRNPFLVSARVGNYVICDEGYASVTSLISDYFDLDVPDEILDAIDAIEEGIIEENELSNTLFVGFVTSIGKIPFNKIAQDIKNGDWDKIIKWFEKRAKSKDADMVKRLAKTKTENADILIDKVRLVLYKAQDPIEAGAARLALIMLQREANVGVILAHENQFAKKGMIATRKKRINLLRVIQYLEETGWMAGGRRDVGGFKIPEGVTVTQAIEHLRRAFSTILK